MADADDDGRGAAGRAGRDRAALGSRWGPALLQSRGALRRSRGRRCMEDSVPVVRTAHDTAARRGAPNATAAREADETALDVVERREGGQRSGSGHRLPACYGFALADDARWVRPSPSLLYPLLDHQVRHVVRRLRRNALACLATHGARRSANLEPASCLRLSLHVVAAGEISVTDGEIIFGYKEAEQLPCHQVQLTG